MMLSHDCYTKFEFTVYLVCDGVVEVLGIVYVIRAQPAELPR